MKSKIRKVIFVAVLMLPFTLTALPLTAQNSSKALKNNPMENYPVHYKTIKAGGLNIFYREAGPETAATILLML